ncbi:uncharacterized protein EI90DRAFT_3015579 [Cantharellus anzutake]|uniref:uncharacterized protein n=1 Tax=Cantharellus anzutake TaxID=1750568 RepID=UPI0019061981|nr:uncharacterized protein EI90DRAFT_3015579 [Cantharellus anzutake]KAF8333140.1 hypothetical protein EI90DRAFT_3015579 [Cantharellus anzutake]
MPKIRLAVSSTKNVLRATLASTQNERITSWHPIRERATHSTPADAAAPLPSSTPAAQTSEQEGKRTHPSASDPPIAKNTTPAPEPDVEEETDVPSQVTVARQVPQKRKADDDSATVGPSMRRTTRKPESLVNGISNLD